MRSRKPSMPRAFSSGAWARQRTYAREPDRVDAQVASRRRSTRREGRHGLVFLLEVVEQLVMRHDHLQRAVARIRVRFAAIEAGYRPSGAADFGIKPDDNHAPGLLATREAAQFSGDHVLNLVPCLGALVHDTRCGDEMSFRQTRTNVRRRRPSAESAARSFIDPAA